MAKNNNRKPKKIILLLDTSRAFSRAIIRGISRYSREKANWTFYRKLSFHRTAAGEKNLPLEKLKAWSPDAVILREPANIDQLASMNLPIIVCPYLGKPVPNAITIDGNHRAEGKTAAEYFIDRGFTHLAYVGLQAFPWSAQLATSFANTADIANVHAHIYTQPANPQKRRWINEQNILADWLLSLPKPLAVFACTDERARDCLQAAALAGLQVPDQVAVLGLDNDPMVCELTTPPLSSIARSTEAAGYQAAAILDKQIRLGEPTARKVTITPTYAVTRQSTDALAIKDTQTARAVRFIRDNFARPISVSDVVNATSISRRTAELRFDKILSRSIAAHIRSVRIAHAKTLLLETDLSISAIAESSGFASTPYFSNTFTKTTDFTPLNYRKQHKG